MSGVSISISSESSPTMALAISAVLLLISAGSMPLLNVSGAPSRGAMCIAVAGAGAASYDGLAPVDAFMGIGILSAVLPPCICCICIIIDMSNAAGGWNAWSLLYAN